MLRELGETEFIRRHQCPVRSLAAFEKSEYADDWRELMRLYLVRRTRSFIQDNYAHTDPSNGRKYLILDDGSRSYFPTRKPVTAKFTIDEKNPSDQYARLYGTDVVNTINRLNLPRYGLGNYLAPSPHDPPTQTEATQLQDLSRAGQRLMGFCRTNLFKRLESSGHAFLESIKRHILRNYIYLYAIENDQPLPIGTQDQGLLDARINDGDEDLLVLADLFDDEDGEETADLESTKLQNEAEFKTRAGEIYAEYSGRYKRRFKWLRPSLFIKDLHKDLLSDAHALFGGLHKAGAWNPKLDTKLDALFNLLTKQHPKEKVILFTQFADTVYYLESQLKARGVTKMEGVTGDSADPTALAWRFSPVSNNKRDRIKSEEELRIIIATDVLSEGQNLQDAAVVVNYDLPWAIIRLIQRVGRVDRIGQKAENILCYSFLPADGLDRIIRLRARVRQRLRENAEVVGTDEAFFEDDKNDQAVVDLYNEKSGLLDSDAESEVDLASYAYQIWKNAITRDPSLQTIIPDLAPVVLSTRSHSPTEKSPEGVLVYMKTPADNDALVWVDNDGNSITESQLAVLEAAACDPGTPALPHHEKHHELVRKGVELIIEEEKSVGGQLGRPSGARFRTYERLKRYADEVKGTLFESQELLKAIDDIYRYSLRQAAVDALNRQLRSGISDQNLAQLVMALRDEGRLCVIEQEEQTQEPRIICSLGLSSSTKN